MGAVFSLSNDLWSESDVVGIVQTITNDNPFLQRDRAYEDQRDLLYQRRFVSIPGVTVDGSGNKKPGMVQFRSPEIESDAHAFKNRMLAAPLKIKVAAIRTGVKSEESANRQEQFFYRHYYRWRDRGVFDGALFDMASVGVGWVHLALNTDLLPIVPDYDEDDPDGFMDLAADELSAFTSGEKPDLFVLEHVDANTMYWSPDQTVLIQKALVPMNPLVQQYGERGKQIYLDDNGAPAVTTLEPGQNVMTYRANWARQVTLYTVETSDYCYHVLLNRSGNESQGSVLGAYKNYFGRPTFFPCYGEKTASSDPQFMYRALLNGKYQTVPIKNILRTSMATSGSESAQQRYTVEWAGGGQAPESDDNVTVQLGDDGVLYASDSRYKVVSSGLTVGPDLPGALQDIERADTYGYPKSLNRPEEVAASSGYDRARQQDAVASLLDPPLAHYASMLTDVFRALLNAVGEIDQPITVRSTQTRPNGAGGVQLQQEATLQPDDVKPDTDISVNFNSITSFTRIAMQEEGLKLMQADQMIESDFQTDVMGTDDLTAWRDQRAEDKVIKASDDRAVADVNSSIAQFAEQAKQKAIQDNNIQVPTILGPNGQPLPPSTPAMVPTNGQMLRSDRGPGQPIGPGQSMPAGAPGPSGGEIATPPLGGIGA